MNTHLKFPAACPECNFTSRDIALLNNHSCDVQQQGGRCEDFPACGHEWGDCNGLLYGSDEAIKEETRQHIGCDHEAGLYDCEVDEEPDEPEDNTHDGHDTEWIQAGAPGTGGSYHCWDCKVYFGSTIRILEPEDVR